MKSSSWMLGILELADHAWGKTTSLDVVMDCEFKALLSQSVKSSCAFRTDVTGYLGPSEF